uniref:Uncharacterized protein n=1 Tax=Athene cunicularia TaxID=194338 RepID=A0A663N7S3_ATHCN
MLVCKTSAISAIKKTSCNNAALCLSDFRYSDSTFTFTYIGGSKSVSYSVHVSEDYPDNTYVSSSDNDEDVLVTTEPIPVIFHQIATGNLMSQVLYHVHIL